MDASVFVRQPNTTDYVKLGTKEFSSLPRSDEFITVKVNGKAEVYQVLALHHLAEEGGAIEIYAVQSDPPWHLRAKRAIGFGS